MESMVCEYTEGTGRLLDTQEAADSSSAEPTKTPSFSTRRYSNRYEDPLPGEGLWPDNVAKTLSSAQSERDYNRLRKRAVRAEWIAKNGPCVCGSWDSLEVDHLDPSTKVTSNVWTWAPARREAELAKCRVLCHDCHKDRHGRKQHGLGPYKRGCRCRVCTDAASGSVKQWRAKLLGFFPRPSIQQEVAA